MRRRLSDERRSVTHRFVIAGHKGYLTVGLYDNGRPGELFVRLAKADDVMGTLLDQWATAVSIGLQSGVPLRTYVEKFSHVRFDPAGVTSNTAIPFAGSFVDYITRWIGERFADHLDSEDGTNAEEEFRGEVADDSGSDGGASSELAV